MAEQKGSKQILRMLACQARRKPTPAEKRLWELLRDHRCGGLHFRRQRIVGPFRVDFYCCKANLAVEVDGGVHDQESVQRRDAERQQILELDKGIRFFRITNEDVLLRSKETVQRILKEALDPSNESLSS